MKRFKRSMMVCPCCNKLPKGGLNPELIDIVEDLFNHYEDLEILCAYRCPQYNAELNANDTSQHILGNAVDIIIPIDISADDLANTARESGCTGAIIKHIEDGYVHIDQGPFEIDG